jgi:hypothetical protein
MTSEYSTLDNEVGINWKAVDVRPNGILIRPSANRYLGLFARILLCLYLAALFVNRTTLSKPYFLEFPRFAV